MAEDKPPTSHAELSADPKTHTESGLPFQPVYGPEALDGFDPAAPGATSALTRYTTGAQAPALRPDDVRRITADLRRAGEALRAMSVAEIVQSIDAAARMMIETDAAPALASRLRWFHGAASPALSITACSTLMPPALPLAPAALGRQAPSVRVEAEHAVAFVVGEVLDVACGTGIVSRIAEGCSWISLVRLIADRIPRRRPAAIPWLRRDRAGHRPMRPATAPGWSRCRGGCPLPGRPGDPRASAAPP